MSGAALRRLLHAATFLLLGVYWLAPDLFRIVVATGSACMLACDLLRARGLIPAGLLEARVPVYRPLESARVSGAGWLALGYGAAALFPAPALAAAIGVTALADPAASLAGSRWGRAPAGHKSWPGTLAALLVAALVLGLLGLSPARALGLGVVAALAERWSGAVNDNLVLPPLVAAGVVLLT